MASGRAKNCIPSQLGEVRVRNNRQQNKFFCLARHALDFSAPGAASLCPPASRCRLGRETRAVKCGWARFERKGQTESLASLPAGRGEAGEQSRGCWCNNPVDRLQITKQNKKNDLTQVIHVPLPDSGLSQSALLQLLLPQTAGTSGRFCPCAGAEGGSAGGERQFHAPVAFGDVPGLTGEVPGVAVTKAELLRAPDWCT